MEYVWKAAYVLDPRGLARAARVTERLPWLLWRDAGQVIVRPAEHLPREPYPFDLATNEPTYGA